MQPKGLSTLACQQGQQCLRRARKSRVLATHADAQVPLGPVFVQPHHGQFGVSLVLAHQYLDQLPDSLRSALLGTVGTTIAFRIGVLDAETLEPEFRLNNDDYRLSELPPYSAYVHNGFQTQRLIMPEIAHPVFSSSAAKIKNASRAKYAVERKLIEEKLARFIAKL